MAELLIDYPTRTMRRSIVCAILTPEISINFQTHRIVDGKMKKSSIDPERNESSEHLIILYEMRPSVRDTVCMISIECQKSKESIFLPSLLLSCDVNLFLENN